MPGQLQNNIGMKRVTILRQDTHNPFVHAGTTGRADLRIHRVGDQRVHESHRPSHRSHVDEDPRRHGGVEGSEHRRFRQVERLEKDILRELQPENGCGSQHGEHVLAEGPHPAPHDLAEAGRNTFGHHHRGAPLLALTRTGRPAQVHPVTDQLRSVERVSCRLVPQSPGDTAQLGIRCRTRGRDDQLSQLSLVQACQSEVSHLATLELGESSSQLVGYLLSWIAPAHEDQDRSVSQCPDELTEEEERRRFCPLQVIENEDQRSTAGDSTQEINGGVECEEPFGGVVRTGRRWRRHHSRHQPGAEPRQLAAKVGHMLGQEVEGCVLDARVEHRSERFKRHACLVAASVEHGRHRR